MVNSESTPIPSYADVMTAEQWECSVRCGAFIPDDGIGYWCRDDKHESCVSCWTPKPEWATHVAWYNR
uniref:Uncharacterized protein n=2 Tax=unclassified Seunavirus TaxID=2494210 RepID=A0AAU8GH09_9CAUD